ncbi:hypothetical protein PHYSODRAFT_493210, partial [Phytophthora sojae]
SAIESSSECTTGGCTKVINFVCGSNCVTYLNQCEFDSDNCIKGLTLKVAHKGMCRRGEGGK